MLKLKSKIVLSKLKPTLLALLISLIPLTPLNSQPNLVAQLKNELQKTPLDSVFREFRVSVNLDLSNSTERMVVAPVRQNWSDLLEKHGQSVPGVLYTTVDLKAVGAPKGLYAVVAKGSKKDATWFLLRPDFSPIGKPIKVTVTSLLTSVKMPRAFLLTRSPARGCFEDDGVRHCGDFD